MLFDVSAIRNVMLWSAGAAPLLTKPLGAALRLSWSTSVAATDAATDTRASSRVIVNIVGEVREPVLLPGLIHRRVVLLYAAGR